MLFHRLIQHVLPRRREPISCGCQFEPTGDGSPPSRGHGVEESESLFPVRIERSRDAHQLRTPSGCLDFARHERRKGAWPSITTPHSPPSAARSATGRGSRSEEHTSALQSLMRNSYAVSCLKKQTQDTPH